MMDADGYKKRDGWLRTRDERLDWLHPRAVSPFTRLAHQLKVDAEMGVTKTRFEPFECYRTPQRQRELYDSQKGVTGADMYQSAHQFGLAVDFVPRPAGSWSWDGNHDWDHLLKRAKEHGLVRPYSWDLAHIEHPYWSDLRHVLRNL